MKTNKLFPVLTFLAGIVAGGFLLSMVSFMSPPPPAPVEVTPANARTYFDNYINVARSYNAVLKGYTIDINVFNSMTRIYSNDKSVTGFRIYKGLKNQSDTIAMVAGIKNGLDVASAKYYESPSGLVVGPCPTVCDASGGGIGH